MLNQRDHRWANIKLGTSNVTIGSHGCVITCISEVIGKTPDYVNQRLIAVGGYASSNLVIWSKVEEAVGAKTYRYFGYDNAKVLEAITRDGQCMAEVDARAIGGTGKHWILLKGNKVAGDPWFGEDRPTSNYTFTGYATIAYTKPEPIEDPCLNYKKEIDEKNNQIRDYDRQVSSLLGEKKQLVTRVSDLSDSLGTKTTEAQHNLDEVQKRDDVILTLNKTIKDIMETDNYAEQVTKEQDAHTTTKNLFSSFLWDMEELLKINQGNDAREDRITAVITALVALTSGQETLANKVKGLETLVKKLERAKKPIDQLTTIDVIKLLLDRILRS